ncbi:MAG: hypothetical protein NC483_00610 [Ruminococcus sp.]|nr:hypothetical protein [Ruminococcus sp.]
MIIEDKDILIQGYWIELAKKLVALEKMKDYDAKKIKNSFLEAIKILDKIIELEDNKL